RAAAVPVAAAARRADRRPRRAHRDRRAGRGAAGGRPGRGRHGDAPTGGTGRRRPGRRDRSCRGGGDGPVTGLRWAARFGRGRRLRLLAGVALGVGAAGCAIGLTATSAWLIV